MISRVKLPTGYLIVTELDNRKIETLSIGDYGKQHNVKAEFLGYEKEINGVPDVPVMPLSEKWVVTLSTQIGCPCTCTFCDVGKMPFKRNLTRDELFAQIIRAIDCFPKIKYTERLNLHFARMGEPAFNFNNIYEVCKSLINEKRLIQKTLDLRIEVIHPVFTTMCPKSAKNLHLNLKAWCRLKNFDYNGQAGLQLSINSTCDDQRNQMFDNKCMSLSDISKMCKELPPPLGRKYCLNVVLCDDTILDAKKLSELFNPEHFMVKITPVHKSNAAVENGIKTTGGYESFLPYQKIERDLIDNKFDVLVFIPSREEESSLITCGNFVCKEKSE